MIQFPEGHRFAQAELADHTADSLEALAQTGLACGRYAIGAGAKRRNLNIEVLGDPPGPEGGHNLPSWIGQRSQPIGKTLIYLEQAVHLGQACIADREGGVFPESTAHDGKPARGKVVVRKSDGIYAESDISIDRVIETPVLYLGSATGQFGHFLLDFTSRFWALEWARSRGIKIAVYAPKRHTFIKFQSTLFEAAGLTDDDFVFVTGPAVFRQFYLPSPLYGLHRGLHPEFIPQCSRLAINIIRSKFGIRALKAAGHERIYLSRRLWGKRRILTNEAEVEALFSTFGFEIVHPEQLSLPDQVRIARSARHIAAPIGSQTYLALFQARPETITVLAPTTFTFPDDAIIGAARQATTTYVLGRPHDPASAGPRDHDFAIDLDVLGQMLAKRFSAEPVAAT